MKGLAVNGPTLRSSFRVTVKNVSLAEPQVANNNLIFPERALIDEDRNVFPRTDQDLSESPSNCELNSDIDYFTNMELKSCNKSDEYWTKYETSAHKDLANSLNLMNKHSKHLMTKINDQALDHKELQIKTYSYFKPAKLKADEKTKSLLSKSNIKNLSTFENVYSVRCANAGSRTNAVDHKTCGQIEGLIETSENSSEILQNLLHKFERFYNDSEISKNLRQQDEMNGFGLSA